MCFRCRLDEVIYFENIWITDIGCIWDGHIALVGINGPIYI